MSGFKVGDRVRCIETPDDADEAEDCLNIFDQVGIVSRVNSGNGWERCLVLFNNDIGGHGQAPDENDGHDHNRSWWCDDHVLVRLGNLNVKVLE